MTYPAYGKQLLQLRQNGKRPEHPVIVAMGIWKRTEPNYRIVVADDQPIEHLELQFLLNLDVLVQIRQGVNPQRLLALLVAILRVDPQFLAYYWSDRRKGVTVINNGRPAGWKWGEWEVNRWYGRSCHAVD